MRSRAGRRPTPPKDRDSGTPGAGRRIAACLEAIQRKPAAQTLTVNPRAAEALETVGRAILRYGVLMLIGSGLTEFTEFEAQWIQPLLANSPSFAWMYGQGLDELRPRSDVAITPESDDRLVRDA
jgi:hypothetical protein